MALTALAIGIGANTLVFSVVMAVLVRPLPYKDADRLIWLSNNNSALGVSQAFLNPADILDFLRAGQELRAHRFPGVRCPLTFRELPGRSGLKALYASTNFFETLGIKPALGRDFVSADDERADGNVIISHGLWQRQYGGAPDIIGRRINLGLPADQTPTKEIIGVMPPELNFPARIELWTAWDDDRTNVERGGSHNNRTIARLKRGVSIEQAQAEISAVARTQGELYPETNAGWDVTLVPFREHLFGSANVALPLL
ncbi:MAG: ABC transporter permease [Pyrinomonadaceae bacterium]